MTMKSKLSRLTLTAAPLLLGTAAAVAGELPFQSPTTERAAQTQVLLAQAARAITAGAGLPAGQRISDLWVFPTSDEDTVFAQYVVRTEGQKAGPAAEPHLAVVRMSGTRIAEQRDLNTDGRILQARQPAGSLDWTARIGTGHATDGASVPAAVTGTTAAPHWSALIGTGHPDGRGTQTNVAGAHGLDGTTAHAHWTSKFGTAHAGDSNEAKGHVAS
jgi:hypothetical protein